RRGDAGCPTPWPGAQGGPRNQRVQYSTILAYRTDAFKGREAPVPWKDLLDLKRGLLARRVRVRGKRGERAQPRLVAGPDQPVQRPLLAPGLAGVDESRIARRRALLIRERDAGPLPHRGGHRVDERGEVGAAALPAKALVDLAGE